MSDVATQEPDSVAHKRMKLKIQRDEKELEELLNGVSTNAEPEEDQTESTDEPQNKLVDTKPKSEKASEEETESEPETQEEKTFKKRYGDIRRHMATEKQEYESKIETLKGQLKNAANNKLILPKTDEEIDAWTNKYPDVAAIVQSIAEKKATEQSEHLDKRVKEIEEMRSNIQVSKEASDLAALQPDYEEIRADEAFHVWAEEQPKVMQDILYDTIDAVSISRVIDLYKADKGIKNTKAKSADISAASSVKARRRQTPEAEESKSYLKESEVEKMTAKQYAKHADEIMEAISSGKFIYDQSRK
jgi:hypothetical protein